MKKAWNKLKKIRWYLSFIFAVVCLSYAIYCNNYSSNPRIVSEYISVRNGGDFNKIPLVETEGRVITYTKYGKEFLAYAPGNYKDDFVMDLVAYNSVTNNNNIATDIVIACQQKDYKKLQKLELISVKMTILNGYKTTWAPIKKDECDGFVNLFNYGHVFYDASKAISLWWALFWLLILPCTMKVIDFLIKKMED